MYAIIMVPTILKYFGSSLIKYVQDLYLEYVKDCWNKLDINKQVYCVHKFKDTKHASIFPCFICGFIVNTIKIPARCFTEVNKLDLKVTWKNKEIRMAKSFLKRQAVCELYLF